MTTAEKAKHTPGPWRILHGSYGDRSSTKVIGANGDGTSVAECRNVNRPQTEEQIALQDANARLIAAAPELLHACELALGAFENNNCIDWNILAEAIAKARGEQ